MSFYRSSIGLPLRTATFSSTHLAPLLDDLEAIGATSTGIGRPGGFIDSRADLIRQWIAPAVYPQVRLEITTNGGSSYIADSLPISLQGTMPADVLFLRVLVNGMSTELASPESFCSGSSFSGWTLDGIDLAGGVKEVTVLGLDGAGSLVDTDTIEVSLFSFGRFVRGDGDGDFRADIVDAMMLLYFAFEGGVVVRCEDALDVDDSGAVDATDAIRLLTYLFANGVAPAEPFPGSGNDLTPDSLEDCTGPP